MESIYDLLEEEHGETIGWNWYRNNINPKLFYRYEDEWEVTFDYPDFIKDELIVEEE